VAQQIADRVLESTATTGTGTITLAGALTGFQAFSSVCVNGDTVYYSLWGVDANGNASGVWETGLGTFGAGPTLARTTAISGSSGAGVKVTLPASSYVALSYIASRALSVGVDNGVTLLTAGTAALTTPPASTIQFASRQIANRGMLAVVGPNGKENIQQPYMSRTGIHMWIPTINSVTPPVLATGAVAVTAVGTATARTVAATSFAARMARLGYPSASTAGSLGGLRNAATFFTGGSGVLSDGSGFFFTTRWVDSDPASVTGKRAFIGMSSLTAAPTNVEVSTLTSSIGIMKLAADDTQWYWYGAGSSANQTNVAIGTGSGSPTGGNQTVAWELVIWAPSDQLRTYYLQLTNLTTGVIATRTISGTAVQVPDSSVLMNYRNWCCNNATAAVTSIDQGIFSIETDS
jgi:hypothetical protein